MNKLSKCRNHEEDIAQIFVAFSKKLNFKIEIERDKTLGKNYRLISNEAARSCAQLKKGLAKWAFSCGKEKLWLPYFQNYFFI